MAELDSKWLAMATTALSGAAALSEGRSAKRSADLEADQLARRAAARRAESHLAARDERRQSRLAQSRAQAVAAAGGRALDDPAFANYMGDVAATGEIGAMSRLYEGYEEAAGLEEGARVRRKEGRAARTAGNVRAITSVLSGVEDLRSKYS